MGQKLSLVFKMPEVERERMCIFVVCPKKRTLPEAMSNFTGRGLVGLRWLCYLLEQLAHLASSQSESSAKFRNMAADSHHRMVYIGIQSLSLSPWHAPALVAHGEVVWRVLRTVARFLAARTQDFGCVYSAQ
jgi:hypothetical protein